ncbi:MAG: hypothetical protein ACXABX_08510, partial [Candidatus Thorarchaeota archaeon]
FGNVPLVTIANKQDRDDAILPEQVASWLGVPEAVGMSGHNRESCKDGLILLLKMVESANTAAPVGECIEAVVSQQQQI